MRFIKNFSLFCIGGIAYVIIEMLWRGYSHWSMFLLGGLCFWTIGLINEHTSWKTPLVLETILGGVIVTALEFICGYIVNIKLHMNVWDYSDIPYNIMGQVCLRYSGMWVGLSLLCIIIDDNLRYYLFGEEKQKYTLI